jgi:hypothetical protein
VKRLLNKKRRKGVGTGVVFIGHNEYKMNRQIKFRFYDKALSKMV